MIEGREAGLTTTAPAPPPLRQVGWQRRRSTRRVGGWGGRCAGGLGQGDGLGRALGPAVPHLGAVAALHRCGAEAATVLLGVDGVLDGERRRARFVAANRGVPAITVAVGERARVEAALADLDPAPTSSPSSPWRESRS